jgi:PHD/YefM family antitoxin component YafN of YafNO toxin-antitoxin module
MESISNKLNALLKEIEDAKSQVAILQDRKSEALKRLKNEYKLNSLEDAVKYVGKLKTELVRTEEVIKKEFEKLQKEYEW